MKTDPFIQQFVRDSQSGVITINGIIGEKRYLAQEVFSGRVNFRRAQTNGIVPFSFSEENTKGFASWLFSAPTYVVDEGAYQLIKQLAEKIKGINTPPKKLPFEIIYVAYNFEAVTRQTQEDIAGTLFFHGSSSEVMGATLLKDNILIHATRQHFVEAMLMFLEEKILRVERHEISPKKKKLLKKLNEPLPDVRIIKIREYEKIEAGDTPAGECHREYHRQWLVRGHLRAQWYPSKQHNELIWIDPYKKGPEGAPFIETVHHVCR